MMMKEILYGKAPVLEALRAKRRKIYRVFLQKKSSPGPASLSRSKNRVNHQNFQELLELTQEQGLECRQVSPQWFQEKLGQVHHQGWAAEVGEFPALQGAEEKAWRLKLPESGPVSLLALDQVQDPQNLGAILRSAEACGVVAVLVTEQNSAPLSPAVSRASAGALEHLTIIKVKNLARSIKYLKNINFWTVGTSVRNLEPGVESGVTEEKGQVGRSRTGPPVQDALNFEWPERCVLVLGSEGQGMRRLTSEACDFLIHLPLLGRISSLNVAATATACLYLKQCFLKRFRPV